MIQKVFDKKKLIALIIKPKKIKKIGPNFLTPINFTQQLGVINYPKNHFIAPHTHKKYLRKVTRTSEVLIIEKGILRTDFYNNKKVYMFSKILKEGDIIFLHESHHGFKIIKDCSIVEIKQGPYIKLIDKVLFKKVDEKKIKIK
tara:strand:+ start:51 stop:482 length:432 start_codon:yes stop_codon:yes gene_type:complete